MSSDGLLERLDELLPVIRARRDEIEQSRQLPRDLVDEMRKTGIFSLAIPRAVGGQEAAPADILRVIEKVATADGSAGWCTMIGLSGNIAAGYMNEPGAREIFADPNIVSAGIAAPAGKATRVDGGVKVSGRWSFASGVTHSEWLFAGCMVHENDKPRMTPLGPETIHIFVPTSEVTIHDTWFVSGLNGTGSNDISISDSFVPDRRIFFLLDSATHRSEPLYQMPPVGWFVSQVAAVSLGIARAALDELIDLAQTKMPTLSTIVLADIASAQIGLARAEAALAGARALLHESVGDLWNTLKAGKTHTMRQMAMNRVACLNAAETGASVTRTANTLAGGSSIYTKSTMQRHMRDAEAITHHFTVAPHVWEDAGRVFLGRKPTAPIF